MSIVIVPIFPFAIQYKSSHGVEIWRLCCWDGVGSFYLRSWQLAVGSQFPRLLASDQINQGGWFKLSHQTLSVKSLGLIKKNVLDSNRCKNNPPL